MLRRQLWHLALADGLFALTELLLDYCLDLMGLMPETLRTWVSSCVVVFFCTSWMLEMHVAAGVAAL